MRNVITVLLAAWFGAYLMAGYGVAPLLFQNLPKMQAGLLAGVLFDAVNYAGMAVALMVRFGSRPDGYGQAPKGRRLSLILFGLLAFSQFMITPVIKALRSGNTHWLSDMLGGSFAAWHGTSSAIYMLVSLLAVVLVARVLQFGTRSM